MIGFDVPREVGSLAAQLKVKGVGFVGRYYGGSAGKQLTPIEARQLSGHGIRIVTVFEGYGDRLSGFAPGQGTKDATKAIGCAKACGQPSGTPIYFAFDREFTAPEVKQYAVPYISEVDHVLAGDGSYKVGAYGSGLVLQSLRDLGLIEYCWLWGGAKSLGTAAFDAAKAWHIKQAPPRAGYLGLPFTVDPDEARDGDFGGWLLTAGASPALPSRDEIKAAVEAMQLKLQALDYYKGAIDGDPGPETQAALAAYRRAA